MRRHAMYRDTELMAGQFATYGRLFRCSLLHRLRHPKKPIGIAQLQTSHQHNLLRVTSEMRHAVEDRRQSGLLSRLNAARLEKAVIVERFQCRLGPADDV